MSLADQIAGDLDRLFVADGLQAVSATYTPQEPGADTIAVRACPHVASEPVVEQADGELLTYQSRVQQFTIIDTELAGLARFPASGDRLAVATGPFAGDWLVRAATYGLHLYTLTTTRAKPIGAGASEARRVIR